MADNYCSSVAWSAVSAWAATHAYSVGNIVRQLATPTVGNERVWRCTTAGTSLGSEPAWTLTKGSTTTESGGPVWTEITGSSSHQQDNGTTTTWAAPHARIENMCSWMAAGDRGFVSSDHTQTKAGNVTLTSPGVSCQFFSVNRTTGNIPPLPADITNGAAVNQTGGGSTVLSIVGGGFWQGFSFTWGTGSDSNGNLNIGASSSNSYYMKNCSITIGSTGTSSIVLGQTSLAKITLENPTFQFGAIGQNIQILDGRVVIIGGSITGATLPTNLFGSNSNAGSLEIRGFDASALTSGKNLIIGSQGTSNPFSASFANCKLSATAGIVSSDSRTAPDCLLVDVINCDSGATNYRNERHRYQGDMTTETTITRTGGATNGTQKVSRKVITTANAAINNPFELPPIAKFNKLTGSSRTATIEIISSGTLNNNDIWVELEYLGSSSTPVSSFANDTIATQLTSSAAQTSSSAAWDSSPSTPVTQKLVATFTPQMAGLVVARVKIAKASTTCWVDPKITIA